MNFRTRRPEKAYLTWAPMGGVLLFSPLNVKSHLTINGPSPCPTEHLAVSARENLMSETIWLWIATGNF